RAERELASIEAELDARRRSAERAALVEAERAARDQAAAEDAERQRLAGLDSKLAEGRLQHAEHVAEVNKLALAHRDHGTALRALCHESEVIAGELGRPTQYWPAVRRVGEKLTHLLAHVEFWQSLFSWQDGGSDLLRDREEQR